MSVKDFHRECRAKWINAITLVSGPTPPTTSVWHDTDAIVSAIRPFADAVNHLHFLSGGLDIARVTLGQEPGTIEFIIEDKVAYLAKPRSMTLEYIPAAPAESFVILDLASLEPSGVYPLGGSDHWHEELVELSPGNYAERDVWDTGHTGYDEAGNEIPLPAGARLLLRIFHGRLMLVTKGSLWNSIPKTYDGRHDRMTNQQIRDLIERSI
jgi:hypothetical protein